MTPAEVQRALRMVTSNEFRRDRYFPVSVIANISGLSRECIYQARAGRLLTPRVVNVLSPILQDILSGKRKAFKPKWQVLDAGASRGDGWKNAGFPTARRVG